VLGVRPPLIVDLSGLLRLRREAIVIRLVKSPYGDCRPRRLAIRQTGQE
jgi:hypothetical protein